MENFEILRKFETLKFKIYDTFGRPEGGEGFKKLGQCQIGGGEGAEIGLFCWASFMYGPYPNFKFPSRWSPVCVN